MAHAYRRAARHSRRVRFLRLAIPTAFAILVVGLAAAAWFNPLRMLANLPSGMGKLVISGSKVTMEFPRLAGFTPDGRAYEMSANAAAQDLLKPDLLELRDIRAKIDMPDKTSLQLVATTGFYDSKAEILKLDKGIVLTTSNGYEGQLSEAVVDVRKGHITSSNPVEAKLLNGTLKSNQLEVTDSGDVIRFGGGVSLTMMMDDAAIAPRTAAVDEP